MKPTEADIKGLLIEGWEIGENGCGSVANAGWLDICKGDMQITFYNGPAQQVGFAISKYDDDICVQFKDFLDSDYDLSLISQHYEPEEWQRIITMCERIVRLITGEQTLEEKVRKILEPTSAAFVSIVGDKVFIRDSDYKYWISNQHIEYMSLFKGSDHKLHRQLVSEYFCDEREEYWPATVRRIAALLTPSDQPEQTLEEAVRGWFDNEGLKHPDAIRDTGDSILLEYNDAAGLGQVVYQNKVLTRDGMVAIRDVKNSCLVPELQRIVPLIAAELSKRSTKPSYSDLEQRVEELEKLVDEEHRKAKEFHRDSIAKSDRIAELERENESLLDRFGPIDQAEQQYVVARKEFETFAEKVGRWAQGIIELNEEIL